MMNIIVQTADGKSIEQGISAILKRIADRLNRDSGKIAAKSMTDSVKNWVQQRYPGSKHYDPNKVQQGDSLGVIGTVNVDIPGISRAYHDITIKPIRAKSLTIPIHQAAYGKKAADFDDLFKPKGKNILARMQGNDLVAMFVLAKSAFQKQDKSLMPPDDHLAGGIFRALCQTLRI